MRILFLIIFFVMISCDDYTSQENQATCAFQKTNCEERNKQKKDNYFNVDQPEDCDKIYIDCLFSFSE